jgi:DNA-binding NtrC family response regulator
LLALAKTIEPVSKRTLEMDYPAYSVAMKETAKELGITVPALYRHAKSWTEDPNSLEKETLLGLWDIAEDVPVIGVLS